MGFGSSSPFSGDMQLLSCILSWKAPEVLATFDKVACAFLDPGYRIALCLLETCVLLLLKYMAVFMFSLSYTCLRSDLALNLDLFGVALR